MISPPSDVYVTVDKMNGRSLKSILYLIMVGPFKLGFSCFRLFVIEPYLTFVSYMCEIILAPIYVLADLFLLLIGASNGHSNIVKPLNNIYREHPLTPKNLNINRLNQNKPLLSFDYWSDSVSHLLNPDNAYLSQKDMFLTQYRRSHRELNFIIVSLYLCYKFAFISLVFIIIVSISTTIPFILFKLVFNSTNARALVRFILEAAQISVDKKMEELKIPLKVPIDNNASKIENETSKVAKIRDPIKSSLISNADEFDEDILVSRINTSIDVLKDNDLEPPDKEVISKINNIDPFGSVLKSKHLAEGTESDEPNTQGAANDTNSYSFETRNVKIDFNFPNGNESNSSGYNPQSTECQSSRKRKNHMKKHDTVMVSKANRNTKNNVSFNTATNANSTNNFTITTSRRTPATTINSLFSQQNDTLSDSGDTNDASQADDSMVTDTSMFHEKPQKPFSS